VAGSFYKNLDGVMLVFDLTNEKSFQNLTKWLSQINQVKPCPYMISGNKADLEPDRIVSDEEIKDIEQKFNS
jgi:GTPase SAR1 family protein